MTGTDVLFGGLCFIAGALAGGGAIALFMWKPPPGLKPFGFIYTYGGILLGVLVGWLLS